MWELWGRRCCVKAWHWERGMRVYVCVVEPKLEETEGISSETMAATVKRNRVENNNVA